jgi:ABC-type maltose transport system permease subunit
MIDTPAGHTVVHVGHPLLSVLVAVGRWAAIVTGALLAGYLFARVRWMTATYKTHPSLLLQKARRGAMAFLILTVYALCDMLGRFAWVEDFTWRLPVAIFAFVYGFLAIRGYTKAEKIERGGASIWEPKR